MDEFEVECVDCNWQGYSSDLVSKTVDWEDKDFSFCPDCGGDDIQEITNVED